MIPLVDGVKPVSEGVTKDGRVIKRYAEIPGLSSLGTLSLTQNTATVTIKEKVEGVSKNGKPWARWQVQTQYIFIAAGNRSRLISRGRSAGRKGIITFDQTCQLLNGMISSEPLRRAAAQMIGIEESNPSYRDFRLIITPALFAGPASWMPIGDLMSGLRQETPRAMAEALFGKTRYRKDLLKAIAGTRYLSHLPVARSARGLVPTDWIVESIAGRRHGVSSIRSTAHARNLRSLFLALDQRTVKRLISPNAPYPWMVKDTIRMWKEVKPTGVELGRFTGWRDLHDHLAALERKIVRPAETIKQGKIDKALDGLEADGLSIRSAKNTHELIDWGQQMSNCIGGYGESAVNGSTHLFGVYRGEQLIANMEVSSDNRLRQLFGKHNRRLAPEEEKIIMDMTGVERSYWAW